MFFCKVLNNNDEGSQINVQLDNIAERSPNLNRQYTRITKDVKMHG